ncbi:hypothetical protein B296_00033929, partial [Ensete ventricosum]
CTRSTASGRNILWAIIAEKSADAEDLIDRALFVDRLLHLPWHVTRRQLSGVRGYCSSIGCCVCPDTPFVANCQGSGGTVRRSGVASALTRCLSPVVGGQGALVEGWFGTSALLCRPLSGRTISRSQDY